MTLAPADAPIGLPADLRDALRVGTAARHGRPARHRRVVAQPRPRPC